MDGKPLPGNSMTYYSTFNSQLLAKKAKDVSSVLRFQVQTLDQTKKLSEAVPALQQGTKELATWMKLVLTSVESFSETKDDVFNIKENVKVLTRLALVARSSHAEYAYVVISNVLKMTRCRGPRSHVVVTSRKF